MAAQISRALTMAFSVAFAAYGLAWTFLFVFVFRVFGDTDAVILSLVTALPAVIFVRLWQRWKVGRWEGLLNFFVLLSFVILCAFGVIQVWYDKGMDRRHVTEVALTRLIEELQRDPAFADVRFEISPKQSIWAAGTVATDNDLARLKASRTSQGEHSVMIDRVHVAGRPETAKD